VAQLPPDALNYVFDVFTNIARVSGGFQPEPQAALRRLGELANQYRQQHSGGQAPPRKGQ
jgi:hypothetical protein